MSPNRFVLLIVAMAALIELGMSCKKGYVAKKDKNGKEIEEKLDLPKTTVNSYDEAMAKCLKSKNLTSQADAGIANSDLQCVSKYAWTVNGCSAKQFCRNFPADYVAVFNYSEPMKANIKFGDSCTKMAGGTKSGQDGFFLVQWYCAEFCEDQCKPFETDPTKMPYKAVDCPIQGKAVGCDQEQVCKCTANSGVDCGPKAGKAVKFGDMLEAYKRRCMQCKFNLPPDPKDPYSKCVEGAKNFNEKPKSSFDALKAEYVKLNKG